RYRRSNLEFLCGSAEALPIAGRGVFDTIVSFETVEHLSYDQQLKLLEEIKRLLSPDGLLLISTPNKLLYSDRPGYRNPFHYREFYEREFTEFLGRSFRTVHLLGQRVYPVSYIWPSHGELRRLSEHQIAYSKGYFGPAVGDQKELLYMLAVCSDAEIPAPDGS